MRNSRNKDRQMSLLGLSYCQADSVSPLIKPEDKGLIMEPCPGNYINMVDCQCEDIQTYIDEVDGLSFETKNLTTETPLITQSIPVIPKDWFNHDASTIPQQVVGIRLGDILTHQASRNNAGVWLINEGVRINLSALASKVFRGKKIILFTTGPDIIIETLWQKQFEINLYEEIASAGFYAVTGMNFSLFLHECPLGHLINLNKSLKFCEELDKLGVPIIPHVYAITETQRKMWVNWLNTHPNINTVLINTQMQRGNGAAMDEVKRSTQLMLDNTDVGVILNGFQPKNPPWGLSDRVILANQFGLKNRAVIENALARERATEQAAMESLLQQHKWSSRPTIQIKRTNSLIS